MQFLTIRLMKGVKVVCTSAGDKGKLGANLWMSDAILVGRVGTYTAEI
jgi:hypothetical protein